MKPSLAEFKFLDAAPDDVPALLPAALKGKDSVLISVPVLGGSSVGGI